VGVFAYVLVRNLTLLNPVLMIYKFTIGIVTPQIIDPKT
jgi:hypothetical protein